MTTSDTPQPVPTSSGPTGPEKDTAVKVLKSILPATSPFIQKIITFIIELLTGSIADFKESGNWTKSQQANILGTQYTFTETLDGSVDITATPG